MPLLDAIAGCHCCWPHSVTAALVCGVCESDMVVLLMLLLLLLVVVVVVDHIQALPIDHSASLTGGLETFFKSSIP